MTSSFRQPDQEKRILGFIRVYFVGLSGQRIGFAGSRLIIARALGVVAPTVVRKNGSIERSFFFRVQMRAVVGRSNDADGRAFLKANAVPLD